MLHMTHSTALLTDMYELTMVDAALQDGTASRRCVFEVFARRLPGGRRYGVVAGIGRIIDQLQDFRFTDEEIAYLRSAHVVSEHMLDYLSSYHFSGNLYGYAEGELYFPGSPILTATGTFAECCLLETLLLSVLNHDSAVATAASRMTAAAHGRPCVDFGARRAHEGAAVAAARAAYVAGFVGTSDLEAGRLYGIPVSGTSAHAFTLLHDTEMDAFSAQIKAMGTGTTLLVDTYDTEQGVEHAVRAAEAAGGTLGAIRVDSGDLVAGAFKVRGQLDALGATSTKITVTNDLDEYALAALGSAPVDGYGVGTRLVTGSGVPTAEMVYKMVARENAEGTVVPVAKRSAGKAGIGGFKVAGRLSRGERVSEELVLSCDSWEKGQQALAERGARPLQVKLIDHGVINEQFGGRAGLEQARARHTASRRELPDDAWRLSAGEPGIPTLMERVD